MTHKPTHLLAAALAATTLGAATASAAELTYVENHNVYVENVDGSARHALSSDGTAVRPYVLPTADEEGNLSAFQADPSNGQPQIVYWKGGAGEPVRHRMPRSPGDFTTSMPTSARMQPDGVQVVLGYTFLAFGDPAQPRYGRVFPDAPGGAGAESSIDYVDLTWYRERPVVARPEGTIYWTGNSRVMLSPTEPGAKFTFAEISADGTRVLVRERRADGSQRLLLARYAGEIPFGDVDAACALPVGVELARGALSRDGRTVAWDDAAGVHVAAVEPDRFDDAGTCVPTTSRTVSTTARMPSFSEATTTAPSTGGGGGTNPPGGGGGTTPVPSPPPPPAPRPTPATSTKAFKITAPGTVKASALRRGVTLTVTAPAAGKLALTLRRGKRTLASAGGATARAGTVKVRLKARRGAGRLAGKATLTARFTPKGGRATSRTLTVRVS